MPIDLPCSGCRRRLSVRDEFANRQVRCPACGALVLAAPPPPPPGGPLLPGFAGPFFTPIEAHPAGYQAGAASYQAGAASYHAGAASPARVDSTWRSWASLLLSPTDFFARVRNGGVAHAARIGIPCLALGSVASSLQMFLILRWAEPSLVKWLQGMGLGEDLLPHAESFGSVLQGQVSLDVVSLLVFPLALHLGVILAGGKGLRQTLRIYFYSLSARTIDLLPFGFLVSWAYLLVLGYIGLRGVHSLSEWRSIGAIIVGVIGGAFAVFISFGAMMLSHGIPAIPLH